MRHLTFVRSAALLAFVTLFSACSSDSTGPQFDGTFTEDDAYYFAERVVGGVEQAMEIMHWETPNTFPFAPGLPASMVSRFGARHSAARLPVPAAGASVSAHLTRLQAAAPGCTISGHGADGDPWNPYDGNENGIPDDFLIKVDCTWVEEVGEGVTVTSKEGQEIRIKERTSVLWGWDASIRLSGSTKWSDGSDRDEGGIDISESLVVTAARGEHRQNAQYWEKGLDGDEPYDYQEGGELNAVFTADGNDIEFEELFPEGTLTLAGRVWTFELGGTSLNWRIHTDDPLEFSPGCADEEGQPFVNGELVVLLNGDGDKGFELEADECGFGWDLEIFGNEDPVPASRQLQVRGFTLPKR